MCVYLLFKKLSKKTVHMDHKTNSITTNHTSDCHWYIAGSTRCVSRTSSSPCLSNVVLTTFCRGRSLGRAQIINPTNTATVVSWYFLNIYDATRTKLPNHTTIHAKKRLRNKTSPHFSAVITCPYIPIINNKKLQETPGKIIAQTAIAAARIIIHQWGNTCVGLNWINAYAKDAPTTKATICCVVRFFCCLVSKTIDAITSPAKNHHTRCGSVSKNLWRNWEKKRILTPIHTNKTSKKLPSTRFQTCTISHLNNNFRVSRCVHARILTRSFSYIHEINAIVPPLTHGTISHAHITRPIHNVLMYCICCF